jgi:hypothetical protein
MKFVHEQHLVERQKTKVETSSLRTLEIMPRNPNESVCLRIPSLESEKLSRLCPEISMCVHEFGFRTDSTGQWLSAGDGPADGVYVVRSWECKATMQADMSGKTFHVGVTIVEGLIPGSSFTFS